ncbi:glycosyltransferase [Photobacterium leiognathi subsp. mandapamensis]|uniref:glycosyltransferase n=1 Tax=Photobacterium leiognathi TaxID=553611 RepID=UPI000D17E241|nr:glycosyltransferase [Photobacterium leiognathi]PSW64520.1 glycosyltransferase [Photobacterium leiognathi subsp. mandapamensis]
MKKKIAIAIDSLTGGGAEKVMLTLASDFAKLGHDVHILIMLNECLHEIPEGITLHYCFASGENKLDSLTKLNSSVIKLKDKIHSLEEKNGKFDLFLSNLDMTNMLMTRVNVSPLYCVIHSTIEESLKRQMQLGPLAYFRMLRAVKCLDGQNLITVSKGIETEILTKKRIRPKSITTIYNPFDLNNIVEKSKEINKEIPSEDYIIHVGRFAKSKRHDILFKSLKLMNNNIKLVLLCKNRKKAIKSAKKYGVIDRVIIPGFQKNPYPWINKAKLLVLSSDYEGLPTVLIESLTVNTPVVSTDCNYGPNEIMTGELAEFLVPIRDPDHLAHTIDKAINCYPNLDNIDILDKVVSSTVAKQYLKL